MPRCFLARGLMVSIQGQRSSQAGSRTIGSSPCIPARILPGSEAWRFGTPPRTRACPMVRPACCATTSSPRIRWLVRTSRRSGGRPGSTRFGQTQVSGDLVSTWIRALAAPTGDGRRYDVRRFDPRAHSGPQFLRGGRGCRRRRSRAWRSVHRRCSADRRVPYRARPLLLVPVGVGTQLPGGHQKVGFDTLLPSRAHSAAQSCPSAVGPRRVPTTVEVLRLTPRNVRAASAAPVKDWGRSRSVTMVTVRTPAWWRLSTAEYETCSAPRTTARVPTGMRAAPSAGAGRW